MSDRPKESLDEVARIAQEHGDYDDHPTLWKLEHWPDCGHQGCAEALRDTVVSQGMVPASRADLLAALGFEKVKERFCAVHGAVYYFKGSDICGMHQVLISAGKDVSRTCVPTTVWMEAAIGR